MSDILRDIVRATCGGQSQQVKDYIYESMVLIYNGSKKEDEEHVNDED